MAIRQFSDGLLALALACCVVAADYHYDEDYRPRERARSECAEEAHDQGYRRVDVQTVRSRGRGEFEVDIQARDRTGRDARLRCEYDARYRRARISRADR